AIKLRNRYKSGLLNPLLITIIILILFLKIIGMPADLYNKNTEILMYLLTPATISLALPLYQNLHILKQYWKAMLTGITAGVMINLILIFGLSKIFRLTFHEYITILPKSITSAIGLAISEEFGGDITVTILAVILTGVIGNILADGLFYRIKLKNKMVKGVALGTSAHAIGTSKAMEYGKSEGGMASIAIVISGVITVAVISIFTKLY
ncbi:MAG: LrgB family protein, partial [Lachnospiraceae bacterium]|nr:LrgB family protein [Lachnospiraceae bacterium]